MFPHATCLCVKSAPKCKQNECELSKQQAPSSHNDQSCHSSSSNSSNSSEKRHHHHNHNSQHYPHNQRTANRPWIIHRRIDFVEISVLNSHDVLPIGQKSSLPRPLCNRQVSQYCIIGVFASEPKSKQQSKSKCSIHICTYSVQPQSIDFPRSLVFDYNLYANVCAWLCTTVFGALDKYEFSFLPNFRYFIGNVENIVKLWSALNKF